MNALRVGHKEIIAHQLHPIAQPAGQFFPAFGVRFPQGVFQAANGVLAAEIIPPGDQPFRAVLHISLGQGVAAFPVPFAGGGIQGNAHLCGGKTGGGDSFAQQVERFFVALQI